MTTARALKAAGLVWLPTKGDRFVIPDRDMDGDVFVVSDMTVEAQDLASGQVLGFNGTTEWALDSVEAADVLWLPREHQLREALGPAFRSLRPHPAGWEVVTARGAEEHLVPTAAAEAEDAYALALLALRARTAAQALPVAAGDLASVLLPLPADEWHLAAPDGVRTVADVVSGAVGGLGGDPATGWPAALELLLQAWSGSPDATAASDAPADGAAAPADDTAHRRAAEVTEAGARGVLVDLVTAAWDVSAAVGQRPRLDPTAVSLALRHVRTWSSSPTSPAAAATTTPASGAAQDAGARRGGELHELLALTGREPVS